MARGFNTWYNNSVLTHVLMPEGIALCLGFKFFNSGLMLREALIGRLEERAEKVQPGPRTYGGGYTELKLSCSDHELLVQSAAIDDAQYILVTPLKNVKKPPALVVSLALLWNKPGHTELAEGRLLAFSPERRLEVFTDGKRIPRLNTGLCNPFIAVELSGPVAVSTGRGLSAAELKDLLAARKRKLRDDAACYGELAECYQAMRSCLAWDTIYEPEKEQVCSPVSRLWNIRWGGYVLFDWDSYFSALMAGMEDRGLAYANAIAITREKTEAGFIPNFGAADNYKSRDRSQPPVGSHVVRELYRRYREAWFVEQLFDDLLAWNRWWADRRMLKNGQLCWGSDPYTDDSGRHWAEHGVNELLGAMLESGLDNSPMYDEAPFNRETHRMELADVGLTGLYIMDCECLAELAGCISRPEAAELRERAEKSKAGLEELWDEEIGCYVNRRTDTGEFSRRLSPANFYALLSDRVSPDRAGRMVREHFFNPLEFYGEYMLPSISRSDPGYKDQNYWRGRIWAPMNYLAYISLRRAGQGEACRVLAEKSRKLILKEWIEEGHVHENYNADTGDGDDVENSDRFYHWGGLLSFIALMEAGFAEGPENPL
ncbi:MAG: hypothetical protein LBH26_09035 [Treponema sp.]|nr:hypothetical protein [Treponema sp.]